MYIELTMNDSILIRDENEILIATAYWFMNEILFSKVMFRYVSLYILTTWAVRCMGKMLLGKFVSHLFVIVFVFGCHARLTKHTCPVRQATCLFILTDRWKTDCCMFDLVSEFPSIDQARTQHKVNNCVVSLVSLLEHQNKLTRLLDATQKQSPE